MPLHPIEEQIQSLNDCLSQSNTYEEVLALHHDITKVDAAFNALEPGTFELEKLEILKAQINNLKSSYETKMSPLRNNAISLLQKLNTLFKEGCSHTFPNPIWGCIPYYLHLSPPKTENSDTPPSDMDGEYRLKSPLLIEAHAAIRKEQEEFYNTPKEPMLIERDGCCIWVTRGELKRLTEENLETNQPTERSIDFCKEYFSSPPPSPKCGN